MQLLLKGPGEGAFAALRSDSQAHVLSRRMLDRFGHSRRSRSSALKIPEDSSPAAVEASKALVDDFGGSSRQLIKESPRRRIQLLRGITSLRLEPFDDLGNDGDDAVRVAPERITDDRVRECTIGREIVIRIGRHGTSFVGARCLGAGTMLQAEAAGTTLPFAVSTGP